MLGGSSTIHIEAFQAGIWVTAVKKSWGQIQTHYIQYLYLFITLNIYSLLSDLKISDVTLFASYLANTQE